jgi:hypothetical protein
LKAPDWGITCYNKVIAKKKNFPEGGITMRNLAKVLMMAMVVLAGASTAKAEVVEPDVAAKTLYDAEQRAAETGKDKTVKVSVECNKKQKKQNAKYLKISKKFGTLFFQGVTNEKFIKTQNTGTFNLSSESLTTKKGAAKTSFSKGVLTIKVTFNGKLCRSTNDNLTAAKDNLKEFEERIQAEQPQTQRELAWFCAKFVSEHAKMNTKNRKTNTEVGFRDKKAGGDCSDCALWIATYMKYAGVKHYGTVSSKKADHEWNYVMENGVKYYVQASDSQAVLEDEEVSGCNSYEELMSVTREYIEENSIVNVKSALEGWDDVHAAGSEANYYVRNEKRWRSSHTSLNKNDWTFEKWDNR